MKLRHLFDLIVLAALWGASFLLMRIAVPEFGAIPLIELRVAIAALTLAPFIIASKSIGLLREHWKPIAVQGVVNAALPFCLLAIATHHMSAGFVSIANSSAPLFAGLVAWACLGENVGQRRIFGLVMGFAGVVILLTETLGADLDASLLAAVAAITAAASYGYGAVCSRKALVGVNPLTVAAGSQIVAAVLLLLPATWSWPDSSISGRAIIAVVILGVVCTGLAFTIYYRLIANIGPTRAITVTYLVPVFAVVWGGTFLDESVTGPMALGGSVILIGTAFATGLAGRRRCIVT